MIYINGRRIYEHRHVMEMALGRKLKRNEHVHHKDGNRINNNISNLELTNASDHARLHISSEAGLSNRAKEMSDLGHLARWGFSREVPNSDL